MAQPEDNRSQSMGSFRNPIIPGFNPDPSICSVKGKGFFVVVSSFLLWPALPIYHSTDLIHWTLIGHAINRSGQGLDMRTTDETLGLLAPTIRYVKYRDGRAPRWYVTCCCQHRARIGKLEPGKIPDIDVIEPRGFYLWTEDIFNDRSWSSLVYGDQLGIDQDLFFEDDGRVYMTTAWLAAPMLMGINLQTRSSEIDIDSGRSLNEPVVLRASPSNVAEGAHIHKVDGWYYLFVAEGGTQKQHSELVFRSRSPLGPYEEPPAGINPLVANMDDHLTVQNTGHMDIVQGDDGRWWAIFLAVRPVAKAEPTNNPFLIGADSSPLGRETFLAPLEWKDGWPVVNGGKAIDIIGHAQGLSMVEPITAYDADFSDKTDLLGWYSIRTPVKPCFEMKDNLLRMYGTAYTLDVDESPSLLLRKQIAFDMDWEAEFSLCSMVPSHSAGTCIYISRNQYAALELRRDHGGKLDLCFLWSKEKNTLESPTSDVIAESVPDRLRVTIRARRDSYEFLYEFPDLESGTRVAGKIPTGRFHAGFLGMSFGLYANGSTQSAMVEPAVFYSAGYKVVDVDN